MNTTGNAWKVGNDIDTDLIIPARYLNDISEEALKKNCLNDVIENFNEKISSGDILVAGKNFGCGSSREHAPVAIKYCNVSCVIAESFARIFYRNSINIGLPIISSEEAAKKIDAGDKIQVDFENGKIKNLTKNEEYEGEVFPKFIMDIIKAGDLINYTKKRVNSGE